MTAGRRPLKTIIAAMLLVLVAAVDGRAQSLESVYNAAVADMDARRWQDAATKFESILKEDADHIPTRFNLAICLTSLGRRTDAVAIYVELLDKNPTLFEARINLGILWIEALNFAAAREQFERASLLKPDDPVPVLYQARSAVGMKDTDAAVALFRKAIELRPDDPGTRFEFGRWLLETGRTADAAAQLEAARDRGLRTPVLLIALGDAEDKLGRRERAIAAFEEGLAADPSNREVARQLGNLHRENGAPEKAAALLKDIPEARLDFGLALIDGRRYAEAVPVFAALAQQEPSNTDILYLLGKSLMETKRYEDAVAVLERVIRLKPGEVEAWGTLGSTYYLLENWPRAAAVMQRFLELRPGQALPHFVLATCLDRLNNLPEAVRHYHRFLELDDRTNDARSFQARQRAKTLEGRIKRR